MVLVASRLGAPLAFTWSRRGREVNRGLGRRRSGPPSAIFALAIVIPALAGYPHPAPSPTPRGVDAPASPTRPSSRAVAFSHFRHSRLQASQPASLRDSRTVAPAPPFVVTSSRVVAAGLPYTWRPGCPVGPSALRELRLRYWGFDGVAHLGRIVVNASVVAQVITVFRALYDKRFPIWEMVPEDAYHGNDNAAASADDTSGFNCRYAVAPGPPRWSVHAYGEAIDVDDVQNPYVDGNTIIPPAGRAYLNRVDVRPGMAVPGGELVDAFAAVGWYWGGRWAASPDYQHFSLTGG